MATRRVAVLGGGMVGGLMARDLATVEGVQVTLVDRDAGLLERLAARAPLVTRQADLADPSVLKSICEGHDLLIGAVPGFLGRRCLAAAIEAGVPMVDISFMPEDALALDEEARRRGVTAVVDCGVAPGLSNLLVGRTASELDEVDRVLILVGGLPVVRRWPWEYAAVFSPVDVLEEYLRPARFVEGGELVTREALGDVELVDVAGVGTLEAFDTDGLRSLIRTIRARHMKEKTMRWPGHADRMRLLRAGGFLGNEPLDVGGVRVRPIDFTARLLFPQWKLQPGEAEFTVLRVMVEGRKGGRRRISTFEMIDRTDAVAGDTSMARTTGYPATAVARRILSGELVRPGVHPPETIGRDRAVADAVLADLAGRGIRVTERVEQPEGSA